jgi:hypothetical protein
MKQSLKNSDLKKMSPDQQDEAMQNLVKVARGKPNGELKDLDVQIHAFELKHQLSSDELRHELAQGKRKESWEICQWLMLLDQRDLLGSRKARSH